MFKFLFPEAIYTHFISKRNLVIRLWNFPFFEGLLALTDFYILRCIWMLFLIKLFAFESTALIYIFIYISCWFFSMCNVILVLSCRHICGVALAWYLCVYSAVHDMSQFHVWLLDNYQITSRIYFTYEALYHFSLVAINLWIEDNL